MEPRPTINSILWGVSFGCMFPCLKRQHPASIFIFPWGTALFTFSNKCVHRGWQGATRHSSGFLAGIAISRQSLLLESSPVLMWWMRDKMTILHHSHTLSEMCSVILLPLLFYIIFDFIMKWGMGPRSLF